MIESTTCPACSTDLLIEIMAEFKGKIFEFPSGIKINCSEVRCGIKNVWTKRVSESLAHDLIEEIKVDFGVYERDNMIMFA